MTWAKFDDRYDDNPKVKRAWRQSPRAVGLHCMAITYSARHETDGMVTLEWFEEKLPNARERQQTIGVLVDCGLLDALDGATFIVHDYLKFNPSRAKLDERRRNDAARKRTKHPSGIQPEGPAGVRSDSSGSPNGLGRAGAVPQAQAPAPPARPGPAREVQT